MKQIEINLATKYNYHIEAGSLDRLGEMLMEAADPGTRVMVVSDDLVDSLYGNRVAVSLARAGYSTQSYTFQSGEASKTLSVAGDLLEKMAESRMTGKDLVLALGGGVSMDVAGFAASVYEGGISTVLVPTTLLAAVDTCVSGRSYVNLDSGKNLAWVQQRPALAVCDPETFETLEPEVYAEGTAEAIKYGIIGDKRMFARLSKATFQGSVEDIIETCARIQMKLIREDETGEGKQQLLEVGHTFARAIEEAGPKNISHGSAVAMGLLMSAKAGVSIGLTSSDVVQKINEALIRNGLPTKCRVPAAELAAIMKTDRKRQGDMVSLVFPAKIGKCEVQQVHTDNLLKIVKDGLETEMFQNRRSSEMEKLEEAKSLTDEDTIQQVLVAAAIADRKTIFKLNGSNENLDTLADCLRELGAGIEVRNENLWQIVPISEERIRERGDFLPIINCRENATAFRILVPVMAALKREVFVSGTGDLARSSFDDVIGVMEPHGSIFRFDHFPFELSGDFTGGRFELKSNVNKAFVAGLLMALPIRKENSEIVIEEGFEHYDYVEDTLKILEEFGIRIQRSENIFILKGGQKYISPAGFDLTDLL